MRCGSSASAAPDDDGGPVGERLHEVQLVGLGEDRQVRAVGRWRSSGARAGDAKDAAHAGVRHLDVIDRILLGLGLREIHVEHEMRLARGA